MLSVRIVKGQLASTTYLKNEAVVNELFCNVGVEIRTLNKSQEEFVDNLDVRPGHFQDWLVLFGVEGFSLGIHRWWYGTEQILAEHFDRARIHGLRDDLSVVCDIIEKLM